MRAGNRSKDEYEVSNVPFSRRGARADEFLQALKRIWTDDIVEFKGEFYRVPPSKIAPKPVQKPHFPIYLGGFSAKTLQRIVEYANGWIGVAVGADPESQPCLPLEHLENSVKLLRDQARRVGKDPDAFKVLLLTSPSITDSKQGSQRLPLTGTIEQVSGDLKRMEAIGVDHVILGFAFSAENRDMSKITYTAKQLSKSVK